MATNFKLIEDVLGVFDVVSKEQIKDFMVKSHFLYGERNEEETAEHLFQRYTSKKMLVKDGSGYSLDGERGYVEGSTVCFALYLELMKDGPIVADKARRPANYMFFQGQSVYAVCCGEGLSAKMRYLGASTRIVDKVIAIKTPEDPVIPKEELPRIPFAIYEYRNGTIRLLLEGDGNE